MKKSKSTSNKQSKQGPSHKPFPEIRDNVDSRHGEEQDLKGDDMGHQKKEQHSQNRKIKKGTE